MSWLWGQYINGLAVWGRDPTLTCAYVYHLANRLDCVVDEQCWNNTGVVAAVDNDTSFFLLEQHSGGGGDGDALNWRNCSRY